MDRVKNNQMDLGNNSSPNVPVASAVSHTDDGISEEMAPPPPPPPPPEVAFIIVCSQSLYNCCIVTLPMCILVTAYYVTNMREFLISLQSINTIQAS